MTAQQLSNILGTIPGFDDRVAMNSFPEGEAPELPWIVYRQTSANGFFADNRVYYNSPVFVIELYTEVKSPETEKTLESALASAELIWTKDEDYLDSERCYMIIYTVTF